MTDPVDFSSRLPNARVGVLVKIARMYHEEGLRQPEIATRLRVSQSRVSRYLREASAIGVIRTVVVPPPGFHPALEAGVRDAYNLADVVVAPTSRSGDGRLLPVLGAAAAGYLETTIKTGDRIGISSWSASLIATADAMSPLHGTRSAEIVQLIGGVGDPQAQVQATRLAERLAFLTGAVPRYFNAPGIVTTKAARDAIMDDPYLRATADTWDDLSMVLLGIGSLQPSPLLQQSGNALPDPVLTQLRDLNAVGDICLRFFDKDGQLIDSDIDTRVLGVGVEALFAVPRRIAIAGGDAKYEAIYAAVRGGWMDVLITDVTTAERLVADSRAAAHLLPDESAAEQGTP